MNSLLSYLHEDWQVKTDIFSDLGGVKTQKNVKEKCILRDAE
jgi:hypothetical protein